MVRIGGHLHRPRILGREQPHINAPANDNIAERERIWLLRITSKRVVPQ